jgi:hypothetical protein
MFFSLDLRLLPTCLLPYLGHPTPSSHLGPHYLALYIDHPKVILKGTTQHEGHSRDAQLTFQIIFSTFYTDDCP